MNKEIIENKSNTVAFKIIVGGLFAFFGLLTIKIYVGYFFIIISFIAFFYSSGIEVDFDSKQLRVFLSFFGVRTGRWIEMHNFHSLSLKKTKKGLLQYGANTNISFSSYKTYFIVVLLAKKGTESVVIYSSKSRIASEKFAANWSEKLGLTLKFHGEK